MERFRKLLDLDALAERLARAQAEHAERMKPDDRFERLSASVERKASDPVGFRRLQIEDGWLERHVAQREPHIVVLAGERVKRRRAAFAAVVGG